MAATNTGTPIRWENGGVLRIIVGMAESEFDLVEEGSINWQSGLREGIVIGDRGELVSVKSGNERPSTISFDTKLGNTTFATVLGTLMKPADTAGQKTLFTVEIEYSVGSGTNTSLGVRFADCWMPDGEQFSAGGAGAVDTASFTLNSLKTEPVHYTPTHGGG
jgi:hypothetical protein